MKAVIVRAVLGALAGAAIAWGQGAPIPYTKIQLFSNSGQPLAGGQVCTYISGTTTPLATFSDYTLSQPNPQCVPLDAAGRAAIWLDPTKVYRAVLRDSTLVTLWTQDGITGALGGQANLWSQTGSTVFNSSGSRVCIAATPCSTALAVLDVAGTSSGNSHLVRIDDAGRAPGIDLYGSGSLFGSYLADSTGLRLRAADGTNQLTVASGSVLVQNGAASGGTSLNVKMSATQGSVNPLQIQTSTGTNVAYVDPSGNEFLAGINANGTATNTIQAPTGGVTGKWLIATDSLFLIEEPAPALSAAGQARIYADSVSHTLLVSQNGAAYEQLGSGGGGGGSFTGITSGTNVTAAMVVGTGASLTFSPTGTINASAINATTVPTSPAADMILITTAAGVGAWAGAVLNTSGLANCTDTGGNHLNYNTSTHVFSCGTSGGTVGSVSFGTITSATNSTSAMVVGTGASLNVSGSGTINATQINAGTPPASGSLWKSNGSLQPVTATFADVVGLFSGGAGCSGTNLLAADGTCQTSSGGGSFLPLAGGTMTGNILTSANVSLGTTWANAFTNGLFSGFVESPAHRMAYVSAGTVLDYFDWIGGPSSVHVMALRNSVGTILHQVDDTHTFGAPTLFYYFGKVLPTNLTVNGSSSGTTGHSFTINETGGALGGGVTMQHGGTFDAAWQAGAGAALDIVSNDSFSHRLIVLQTGNILMNRTSDNGTGAVLQIQGGISFTGQLTTPSGSQGINTTISCGGSTRIQQITLSGGIVVAANCL